MKDSVIQQAESQQTSLLGQLSLVNGLKITPYYIYRGVHQTSKHSDIFISY